MPDEQAFSDAAFRRFGVSAVLRFGVSAFRRLAFRAFGVLAFWSVAFWRFGVLGVLAFCFLVRQEAFWRLAFWRFAGSCSIGVLQKAFGVLTARLRLPSSLNGSWNV